MIAEQASMVHTNIHFTHQSIPHGTHKVFILHTQVYYHGRVKFKVYKTQANSTFVIHAQYFILSVEAQFYKMNTWGSGLTQLLQYRFDSA